MKYHLRVYDNYHYADESEAYDKGTYDTYEKAERAAKAIVKAFLKQNWSRGKRADILVAEYCLYGEDPVILPAENPQGRKFSSRDFASKIAGNICRKLENEQKKMEVQTLYQEAIQFAAGKHQEKRQKIPGTKLPYVVHLSNVAMEILMAARHTKEFNLTFAIQVALLHDTLEDTATTFEELNKNFGKDVAVAVQALSKDRNLPKTEQITDSISRIRELPGEVWAVKLADRITNLQPPPSTWTHEKKVEYLKESETILAKLKDGNPYLVNRLKAKIAEYRKQIKRFLLDNV